MPACPPRLERELRARGFEPVVVDVSEFLKAGGGPRCLTLALDVRLGAADRVAAPARHLREADDAAALAERHTAHNYHPLPVTVTHAEGVWVYDDRGRRYLDALSAYSALNFGHRHPHLIAAARDQLDRVTLTSRAFGNDQLGPFARELAALCGKDRVLPMNTGAEAVETAIKPARKWGYEVKGVPPGAADGARLRRQLPRAARRRSSRSPTTRSRARASGRSRPASPASRSATRARSPRRCAPTPTSSRSSSSRFRARRASSCRPAATCARRGACAPSTASC